MERNDDWHRHDALSQSASSDEVIAWHLRHAANCGCHGIPLMVLAQLDARHNRLPPDHELAWSARGTMGLPVAPEAGLVAASAANTLRRTGIEL